MTGFGIGASPCGPLRAEVTVRTLNHRFLSVRPRSLVDRPLLQTRVEERIRSTFHRGEVDVWVTLESGSAADSPVPFDRERVAHYVEALRDVASSLGLEAPSLQDLVRLGALDPSPLPEEDLWRAIQPALTQAVSATLSAREAEGAILHRELEGILAHLGSLADQVSDRLPSLRTALREKLLERIAALGIELDPGRLEMEVALLADRADVEEEVTRLSAHLQRAGSLLSRGGPAGKELDFLAQELLREVNTLGAKARDLEVGALVLDMKVLIERFKEQVQNVE